MSKLEEISSDATLEDLQNMLPELTVAELRKLRENVETNIAIAESRKNPQVDLTELRQLKVAIVNEIAHKQSGAK